MVSILLAPDNPFGSPMDALSPLSPQRTGAVQFSTPSTSMFTNANSVQAPPPVNYLQPQMTGIQAQMTGLQPQMTGVPPSSQQHGKNDINWGRMVRLNKRCDLL